MSIACVALVDDEAPVRVALGRLLRLADFSVLAFASGEQFLASLAAHQHLADHGFARGVDRKSVV